MTHWIKRVIAAGSNTKAPPDEVEEWFTPRFDGIYRGGPDAYRYLHFDRIGGVRIDDSASAGEHGDRTHTATYTGAGRFSIAKPFRRPIGFVVLEVDPDTLTLRITDTGLQQTGEHRYVIQASP